MWYEAYLIKRAFLPALARFGTKLPAFLGATAARSRAMLPGLAAKGMKWLPGMTMAGYGLSQALSNPVLPGTIASIQGGSSDRVGTGLGAASLVPGSTGPVGAAGMAGWGAGSAIDEQLFKPYWDQRQRWGQTPAATAVQPPVRKPLPEMAQRQSWPVL